MTSIWKHCTAAKVHKIKHAFLKCVNRCVICSHVLSGGVLMTRVNWGVDFCSKTNFIKNSLTFKSVLKKYLNLTCEVNFWWQNHLNRSDILHLKILVLESIFCWFFMITSIFETLCFLKFESHIFLDLIFKQKNYSEFTLPNSTTEVMLRYVYNPQIELICAS